jgi:hypothetical protein
MFKMSVMAYMQQITSDVKEVRNAHTSWEVRNKQARMHSESEFGRCGF